MERVIVIGCPGSGKSTFARALRERTGLPLIYLDQIWHKPDRTTVTREEFDARLMEALRTERWIMDGNYARTLETRLKFCDTVFFFDLPTEICLAGAEERVGKPHEDLPWMEETFDPEFRQYILDFRRERLPQMLKTLQTAPPGVKTVVFHSREEAEDYLRREFSETLDFDSSLCYNSAY